jgi:transposase
MSKYSIAFKEATVKRFVESGLSFKLFSEQEGIPTSCIHSWHRSLHKPGTSDNMSSTNSGDWTAEEKFSIVIDTAKLSEIELSEFCREKGLFPAQVKQWKIDFLKGDAPKSPKQESSERKADKLKIKTLERELQRKEKALAEAAALLVLGKNLDAYWEGDEGS